MLKKLLFFFLVLLMAYFFFLPNAINQKQEEFEAAGVGDASVLDLLHPNQDQNP
jgi:hypothetical protein